MLVPYVEIRYVWRLNNSRHKSCVFKKKQTCFLVQYSVLWRFVFCRVVFGYELICGYTIMHFCQFYRPNRTITLETANIELNIYNVLSGEP